MSTWFSSEKIQIVYMYIHMYEYGNSCASASIRINRCHQIINSFWRHRHFDMKLDEQIHKR